MDPDAAWRLRGNFVVNRREHEMIEDRPDSREASIPVVREELAVGKRVVETGEGMRIAKTVSEREQLVDEPLASHDVTVERIRVDRVIEPGKTPGVRHEGATMIVPVLEEVLYVEKRTILKEEIRITSTRREMRAPQRVVLRSEEVAVEPFDEPPSRLP